MACRLMGVRCFFSFGFFAVLALFVLLDRSGLGLGMLGAIVVHEAGHLLAMRLCGAQLVEVGFYPFGIRIDKRGMLSYGHEIAVYLSGPGANLLGALVCLPFSKTWVAIHLSLLIFHMLPVGRLDGGALLRLLLCRAGLEAYAGQVLHAVGLLILAPLFAAALWLARSGNWTLVVTAAYLAATLMDAE